MNDINKTPLRLAEIYADDAGTFAAPESGEPDTDAVSRIQAFALLSIAYSLIEITHRIGDIGDATNQICLAITDPRG